MQLHQLLAVLLLMACLGSGHAPPTGHPQVSKVEEEDQGVFQVREIDDTWYFIHPDGKKWISIGINHVEPIYLLGPYNIDESHRRYGPDLTTEAEYPMPWASNRRTLDFNPYGKAARMWIDEVMADLEDWRFNTLGYHTSIDRSLFKDRIAFIQPLGTYHIESYTEQLLGVKPDTPDVFSPEFSSHVDSVVREVCRLYRNEPNLLGYAFNDVPLWVGLSASSRVGVVSPLLSANPWILAIVSQDPAGPGKQVWLDILRESYSDAAAAARDYRLEASTWEELSIADFSDRIGISSKSQQDLETLLSLIAEKWYRTHSEALEKYDPGHLVFGDKLNGNRGIPDYLLPILEEYVDVVYIQWMGTYDEQAPTLKRIYRKTGKPVLLGDFTFSVKHENQRSTKGVKKEYYAAAGKTYRNYVKRLMKLSFIVGYHHCGYIQGWTGLPDPFAAGQPGFRDPFGQEYKDLTSFVRSANSMALEWHTGKK